MLTRRKFLQIGGAGALLVTAGATAPLFLSKTFSSNQVGATVAGKGRALVIVELSGGNDGLNMVAPYGDPEYYKLRPSLALPANEVLKFNAESGLHPGMKGLHRLYNDGKLAVVQGVCYPNPNYSHFEASDIWQSAQPGRPTDRTGWVGRWLDTQPAGSTMATSLTGEIPLTMYGQTTLVPAINGLDDFNFHTPNFYDDTDGTTRLNYARQIYKHVAQNPVEEFVRNSALDALSTADVIRQHSKEFQPGKGYPEGSTLAQQLQLVAQLLVSGLDFRVFYVKLDGFDTHTNQLSSQADLLTELSESLAAFQADLTRLGLQDNVTTMSFSEFGRRAGENGNGTDHGSAQPMLVLGGQVRGGMFGQRPSLTDLDNGNLKSSVDFRQVYATMLEKWLGVDAKPVLQKDWQQLNLF